MGDMNTTVWDEVTIPTSDPSITTRVHAAAALRHLERLRREVDAASASVTIVLGANSRDTAAEISRATGRSNRQARRDAQTAQAIASLPAAGEALAKGEVSAEHVAMLQPMLGLPGVEGLLQKAAATSVDEFRETVQRFELDARGDEDMAAQHKRKRMLRFFNGELGMVGLTGLLPSIEGARVRVELEAIADRAYRAAHPERAEQRGGHDEAPLAARLADALVSLVNGNHDGDGDVPSRASACRTSVVMTISLDNQMAKIIGQGPVPFTQSIDLATSERVDLYAAILGLDGEVLNLGRDRRFPTLLQRLAVTIRDERCQMPGCDAPHSRAEVHHIIEYDDGGPTVVWNLTLLCDPHHHFLHDNNLYVDRKPGRPTVIRRKTDDTLYAGPRASRPVGWRDGSRERRTSPEQTSAPIDAASRNTPNVAA